MVSLDKYELPIIGDIVHYKNDYGETLPAIVSKMQDQSPHVASLIAMSLGKIQWLDLVPYCPSGESFLSWTIPKRPIRVGAVLD